MVWQHFFGKMQKKYVFFGKNGFVTPPLLLSILYMILNVRLVAAALGPLACSKATALGPESVIT